jgi:hypothetical protein
LVQEERPAAGNPVGVEVELRNLSGGEDSMLEQVEEDPNVAFLDAMDNGVDRGAPGA